MSRDAAVLASGLLVLAVFSLSACGGSDDSPESTDSGSRNSTGSRDSAVRGFGDEVTGKQAAQAEAAAQGYLTAASKGEWKRACSYLAKKVREARASLARARNLEREDCAAGLEVSAERLSPAERDGLDSAEVSGVRVEGKRGYVLYEDSSATERAMPIVTEGGSWKLLALFSVFGVPVGSE